MYTRRQDKMKVIKSWGKKILIIILGIYIWFEAGFGWVDIYTYTCSVIVHTYIHTSRCKTRKHSIIFFLYIYIYIGYRYAYTWYICLYDLLYCGCIYQLLHSHRNLLNIVWIIHHSKQIWCNLKPFLLLVLTKYIHQRNPNNGNQLNYSTILFIYKRIEVYTMFFIT